ncbi:MAG: phenylalanine--tRNA ligase subunit beta [Pseudomonadota bacterium]
MKFSEKWLREWVDLEIDTETLTDQLTMLGLEVDSAESMMLDDNIVVGTIESVEQHPNADKLRVCRVNAGESESLQIVCGAPNAREGITVPVAKVGATLPGDLKIENAKLRGVESSGMLCSAKELGLSDDASGLHEMPASFEPGTSLNNALGLEDTVIDIDLTPNRGDCLSIRGIARDVAARNERAINQLDIPEVEPDIDDTFPVKIRDEVGCPRFTGRIIRGIDPTANTPMWMQQKLLRCGVRPISPVVDITNYVMLELGQPMHGFDLDKLDSKITVRNAKAEEELLLLDGRTVELDENTLVISDEKGAVAIAGIMGGETSGVTDKTTNILFEAAMFDPKKIAGRPRQYSAHSEAAQRFERTVDPTLQRLAQERAARLLIDICGGQPGPIVEVIDASMDYQPTSLHLSRGRIQALLGVELANEDIVRVLSSLGLGLEEHDDGWRVDVPSYRPDISIEEDLVEEIARVYGYDRIPRTHPGLLPDMKPRSETSVLIDRLKLVLVERGYQEAVTYSFVDATAQAQINPGDPELPLANPISSDLSVMRTSIWTGLLGALQRNLSHKQTDVRLFESGLKFVTIDSELRQLPVLSGLVSGNVVEEHWSDPARELDFFDVKGDLVALFDQANGVTVSVVKDTHPALHPGQSARIHAGEQPIGWIGKLHPRVQNSLSIGQPVYLFEVDLEALDKRRLPNFQDFSRFPSIRRDIAIVVHEEVTLNNVLACIDNESPKYLKDVIAFDVYAGKGVIPGRKSLALGLILQDFSRTLTEVDIDKTVSGVLAALEQKLGATLRE